MARSLLCSSGHCKGCSRIGSTISSRAGCRRTTLSHRSLDRVRLVMGLAACLVPSTRVVARCRAHRRRSARPRGPWRPVRRRRSSARHRAGRTAAAQSAAAQRIDPVRATRSTRCRARRSGRCRSPVTRRRVAGRSGRRGEPICIEDGVLTEALARPDRGHAPNPATRQLTLPSSEVKQAVRSSATAATTGHARRWGPSAGAAASQTRTREPLMRQSHSGVARSSRARLGSATADSSTVPSASGPQATVPLSGSLMTQTSCRP